MKIIGAIVALLYISTLAYAEEQNKKTDLDTVVQVLADSGIDAGGFTANRLDLRVLAGEAVHVRGRPAEIGDDTGEAVDLVSDILDLAQD